MQLFSFKQDRDKTIMNKQYWTVSCHTLATC